LLRNAPKRDKKKSNKTTEGEKRKKTEEKKAAFFVMSPDGLFRKKVFFRVFELPLLRKIKIKIKQSK
jgi:hypothetical protein